MRFSVITICFNAEKVIEKTIQSVLAQTYPRFEYIFVDGASDDSTNEIINSYVPKLEKRGISVRHLSERDEGISDAFNKGIRLSAGQIVAIINAGDTLLPDALERVDERMDNATDVVYGNVIWENERTGVRYVRRSKENLNNLIYNMDIMHPATFVKRAVYEKVGLFEVTYRYCMDQDMMVRIRNSGGRFLYADQVFARMAAEGVSDQNVWKVLNEAAQIPLKYGVPRWKVNVIKWYKFLRNRLSRAYRLFVKH